MKPPKDVNGNAIRVDDTVRRIDDRAQGDVVKVAAGGRIDVLWPSRKTTTEPARELKRVNQNPIRPRSTA